MTMKRLILTSPGGLQLGRTDRAEATIPFAFNFAWGELPSPKKLAYYLAARSGRHVRGEHWSDYAGKRRRDCKDPSLIEYCEAYDAIELWFDPGPTDQLLLVWLLDFFRSYPETVSKLILRAVYSDFHFMSEKQLANWNGPAIAVSEAELETASISWQAYRTSTPEACFGLLSRDLSALPSLQPALMQLLNELPGTTGLGATEMRLLEMVAFGFQLTNALFHLRELRGTHIFSEAQVGYLVDGLAHGPIPALEGLDDEIRTLSRENLRDRHAAYLRSRLSITEFGKSVLRHEADFSRHNPIDRWWGGTRLTSDRMWRWNPTLMKP
jgi:hypothetical protein